MPVLAAGRDGGTLAHLSGRLQATQAPVQATLQQTPSAQKPEAHWELSWQTIPSGRRALQALPVQQMPPMQLPLWHCTPQAQASPEALGG